MAGPTLASDPTSKTPGIGSAYSYTVVRMLRQRRYVMGDDHPPLDRRPLQNSGVVRSGEPGVLDADDVEVGFPAKQSPDDVAVEVLVCRESQHRRALCYRRRARSRSRTPEGGNRRSFSWRTVAACCWRFCK